MSKKTWIHTLHLIDFQYSILWKNRWHEHNFSVYDLNKYVYWIQKKHECPFQMVVPIYKAINRMITIFHFAMFSCLQSYSRHLITYLSKKEKLAGKPKNYTLLVWRKVQKFYRFKNCLILLVSIINIFFKLKLRYLRIYYGSIYRIKKE